MSSLDQLRFALHALSFHRLRTGLCLLGIAIGVSAVALLTSLGEGARRYVNTQFKSLGTNLVIVVPGRSETAGTIPGVGGAPNDLTLADARALEREVHQARLVVPISMGSETVANRERHKQVLVLGGTDGFIPARELDLERGENLPEMEWNRSSSVIVLGAELAAELFPGENPLGQKVRVGDRRLRVIGVMADHGQQVGLDIGLMGLVPVATAMSMYDEPGLFRIIIPIRAHADMQSAMDRIEQVLFERHGELDFTVITQDSVAGALGSILGALTLALAGIASISLIVAGIGIMNVMLVTVSERTPEVGLLRALGAERQQVKRLFLWEAALISTVGGALGLLITWGATRALGIYLPNFDASPPGWAVAAALTVSIGVGLIFGVLPANKATRLDPVAALRQ